MRAGAVSRLLRQEAGPYGVQQARNLHNARKCDGGTPSVVFPQGRPLFCTVRRCRNKGWAILLPAAAVIAEPRVVVVIIGLKVFVAGRVSPL
ncbi:hypothetical protein HRED_01344 [Candidatus Haloredivivus sp. G17]|nr:hypothetical protein HRED_01344 [Candidatus Haloredivivus sp. G17]